MEEERRIEEEYDEKLRLEREAREREEQELSREERRKQRELMKEMRAQRASEREVAQAIALLKEQQGQAVCFSIWLNCGRFRPSLEICRQEWF